MGNSTWIPLRIQFCNLRDLCGDSIRMLWDFYSDTDGFYKSSLTFLTVFPCGLYKDFFEDPKGFRVILQGLLEDSTTDFQKRCCRDSDGF